jgi:hypothetical protein
MEERAACAQLKRRFEAAGFHIKENQTFDEGGIRFDIDGYDAARRVGYEYVTDEAGDGWDVDGDVITALAERHQRGELHVLVVDEDDAPDAASLDHAIDEFLKTVPPAAQAAPAPAPSAPPAAAEPAAAETSAAEPAAPEPAAVASPAAAPPQIAAAPAVEPATTEEPAEPGDDPDDDIEELAAEPDTVDAADGDEPEPAPAATKPPPPKATKPPPTPKAKAKATRPPPTPAKKKPARKGK